MTGNLIDSATAQRASAPWKQIFTIERSWITEVSVSGIISLVRGGSARKPRQVFNFGDGEHMLWSRSCLKAWQLCSHFSELKENYIDLTAEHFALMMSSHSAEAVHLKLLNEILAIGKVSDSLLQCPATFPLSTEMKLKLQAQGEGPRSLYHNCSGKHLGYLLAMKAMNLNLDDYLNPSGEQFVPLKQLLSDLLSRSADTFIFTTDGCQLPNYGLTPSEMATLYLGLASGVTTENPRTPQLPDLAKLMRQNPLIIGGHDRFDSLLMSGKLTKEEIPLIAKGGADGLLTIGIGPCRLEPQGLGICIKLAAGADIRHFETITSEILRQLGLLTELPERATVGPPVRKDHLKTLFNFAIEWTKAA